MEYAGVLAGLGNPGERYHLTRHNCGFMLVDDLLALARGNGEAEELSGKKFYCLLWRARSPQFSGTWLLAKPQTFMNESGRALQPLLAWFRLPAAQLIVAHDELDLPPGQIRFKFGGGLAGHNGLRSIAQSLGTQDFYRLRIGIGKAASHEETLNWVLSRPAPEAARLVRKGIADAAETFCLFTRKGAHDATVFARHAND